MRVSILFLAALVALSAASRVTLYHRSSPAKGWTAGERAPADASVKFTVALKQQNLDKLDSLFWDVSDPNSLNYGKYLSSEEVMALTAASEETMSAALSFLSGVPCKDFKDALMCEATVGVLEELFATKFYTMTHTSGKVIHRHLGEVSIPSDLAAHVEFVSGLGSFPVPKRESHVTKLQEGVDITPDYVVVPETLTKFYSLQGAKGSAASTQGVGEFQGEPAYIPADYKTFQTEVALTLSDPTIVGPFNPEGALESALDIQYIAAVGVGNANYYWTEEGWMYEFALNFIAAKARPAVFSMSYAWSEQDQCNTAVFGNQCAALGVNAQQYVTRTNTEFQKVGALGVSLLSASGDSGAHGRTDEECSNPNMFPAFPAASPYLTSVGGTQIQSGVSNGATAPICSTYQCATGGYEIVSSTATGALIVSGGGFSVYAARQSYQDDAVKKYLQNTTALPAASTFNASGRGYPDVAALGHNYYVVDGGAVLVDGTSCATPVFGGVLGLLNSYRLAAKLPVIGFANPLLYQVYAEAPDAFTDIVQGNNFCTEDGCACTNGFSAAPGWDATTGLGSPVFPKLLAAVKAIDARREARRAAAADTLTSTA